MCRLAAYIGPEIRLSRLLDEQPHSLVKQSWAPEEMHEAKLNADGFGFGWYTDDQQPYKYTNILPIWSDINLQGLGWSLKSKVWLANVRSATPGQDLSHTNTQPFIHENYMYLHNGYITDFNRELKQRFQEYLTPAIRTDIHGNTDSEYLFALFRQNIAHQPDNLIDGFRVALQETEKLLQGTSALINIIIYDGKQMIGCRHAVNDGQCPSLYYTSEHPDFPNASLVASERFSDPAHWQQVKRHSILVLPESQPFSFIEL